MACAPGVSQSGVGRQVGGVAVTACNGADCCCGGVPCWFKYVACTPAGCQPLDDTIYLRCSTFGGEPTDEVVRSNGICYTSEDDTKYTTCNDGDPPDGFECLPKDAILDPPFEIEPNCETLNCVGEYFRAASCPGTIGSAPCIAVPCSIMPANPGVCIIFRVGDFCYTVSRQHGKVDPDIEPCQVIGSFGPQYNSCCHCFESGVESECDIDEDCYSVNDGLPNNGTLENVADTYNLNYPPIVDCCCDKENVFVSGFATRVFERYQCIGLPCVDPLQVQQTNIVTVFDNVGTSFNQDINYGVNNCNAGCTAFVNNVNEQTLPVFVSPTRCCPDLLLLPIGQTPAGDSQEIIGDLSVNDCGGYTLSLEIRGFIGDELFERLVYEAQVVLSDSSGCGSDCDIDIPTLDMTFDGNVSFEDIANGLLRSAA